MNSIVNQVSGALFLLVCLQMHSSYAEQSPEVSFDGLVAVEDAQAGMAYIDPEADFSVFQRIAILDPHVSFRSNWQRDVNRGRRTNVSNADMERIKTDAATMFKEIFTERLTADEGFTITDTTGDDVLVVRPAIINLDIAAPDTMSAGRSRTFTAETGEATLYIELFDGASGQIIGRAADRTVMRTSGAGLSWSNRITNSADARRMMGRWADLLREFLDTHYSSSNSGE